MTQHFKLFRRDIYNSVGGIDLAFDTAQDWDLCLKISEVSNIYFLDRQLYYYRSHQESISSSQYRLQRQCSIIAIENALTRRGLDRTLSLDTSNGFKLVARQSH
jgi:GT2 family glycosyltransferase